VAGRHATKNVLTPPEVADGFDAAADTAERYLALTDAGLSSGKGEWECTRADLKSVIALGHYYADKVRGATELMSFYATGDEQHRKTAVSHLEHAVQHWQQIMAVADAHYIPHEIWLMGQFDWTRYLPAVQRDVEVAQQTKPWSKMEQTWVWSNGVATKSVLDWNVTNWTSGTGVKAGDATIAQWARIFRYHAMSPAPSGQAGPRSGRAQTTLTSESNGQALLRLDAPGVTSVELNDSSISSTGTCFIPVKLQAGANTLTLKYAQPPTTAPRADIEQLPGGSGCIFIEAESGILQSPMRSERNSTAVGGKVAIAPLGTGLGFDEVTGKILDKGWIDYRVQIPQAGPYCISARGYWVDGYSDSFFYVWDDGKPGILGNDSTYGMWHWIATDSTQLTTGEHRLRIRTRGDGALLDCLVVTPVQ
jgi:hypothetical protein